MAVVDIVGEQTHADALEDEVERRDVGQTEDDEHTRAEIECQHAVEGYDGQRAPMELLTDVLGDVVAVALCKHTHETLELRCLLLLLPGVAYIAVEEHLPKEITLPGSLVVELLLLGGGVELTALLALLEEKVYLDVVVGKTLLRTDTVETRYEGKDEYDETV